MSRLNRMRRVRHSSILPGALAAIAAFAFGTAPTRVQASLSSQAPSREFVNPAAKPQRKKKKGARNRIGSGGLGAYYHGGKNARRRVLIRLAGVPDSGRQWVRLRKMLRKHAPQLLTAHPHDLLKFEQERSQ